MTNEDTSPGADDDDFGADPFDDESFDEELSDDVDMRDRLEEEADRAVESFDEGVVDLLSWVLDTETRARIYVHLRQHPNSTSDEIANGTGLYPSTVREALAELHEEGTVTRHKRENSGAGNNPYEYATMAPSDLVSDVVDDVQSELNTVFNLDSYLGTPEDEETETESEPVTISVSEESDDNSDSESSSTAASDSESHDETDDN